MEKVADISAIRNFIAPLTEIPQTGSIMKIAGGWNNEIYQIGDSHILKIPLNRENEKQLDIEIRVSKFVSGRISVPVPVFVYAGRMENGIFAALYKKLKGVNITNTTYGRQEDRITPSELGSCQRTEFYMGISHIFGEIGCIDFPQIHGFPRKDGTFLIGHYKDILRKSRNLIYDSLDGNTIKAVEKEFSEVLKPALFDFSPRFIHGDLGGWNILYDKRTENISGLIDWGNSSFSDPALDYSELVYDYGDEFSRFFRKLSGNEMHEMDDGFMRRTAFYIRISGIIDALYGVENRMPSYVRKGIEDIETKFIL